MEIDVSSKCRTCLNEDEEMHDLFSEFDQGVTLQEIFTSTSNFEIDREDGLSSYLCQNCTTIIVDFYNLKTVYQENEAQIRALLSKEAETADTSEKEEQGVSENCITIKVESGLSDGEHEFDNELIKREDSTEDTLKSSHYAEATEETDEKGDIVPFEYQQITTYTCPECGDCFLYKNDVQEHMLSKHDIPDIDLDELAETSLLKVKILEEDPNSVNKCKLCGKYFETSDEYKEHLESHKKNVCDICGVGFVKKSYLRDHQEIHLTEKRHVCNFCNKAFKRRTVLVKHRRIHTNPRECICEICGKAFNDKGTLKTHIMLLHVKERNFMCLLCGVKFPLKATLEKHIRRHQNKERQFFCTQCPLGYKDKSSLDRHIFVKHSGQSVKVTCDDCGREYTTASNLFKHQRSCHGAKPPSTEDQENSQ